ncbi:MAG: hypothetical protein EXR62_00950 [Chloroflexi bacterium]|nr:hypothetical protein [Chloroflexota bacterium]
MNTAPLAALLAAAWLGLVGLLWYSETGKRPVLCWNAAPGWQSRSHSGAWLLLLIALLIRLLPAFLLQSGAQYDLAAYEIVGRSLDEGTSPYQLSDPYLYPYLPLHLYLEWGIWRLAQGTGLPFTALIKIPAIIADGAISLLIYRLAYCRSLSIPAAWRLALSYALNPTALVITAYHGQFDAIPLALLLGAWALVPVSWRHIGSTSQPGQAQGAAPTPPLLLGLGCGLILGLATAEKTWPALWLLLFWFSAPGTALSAPIWRNLVRPGAWARGLLAGFLLPLVLILLPFWQDLPAVAGRVIGYTPLVGAWGIPGIAYALAYLAGGSGTAAAEIVAAGWRWIALIPLAAAGLLYRPWLPSQWPRAGLAFTLLLYVVAPGFGVQYLIWALPFLALSGEGVFLRRYTMVTTLFLGIWYLAFPLAARLIPALPGKDTPATTLVFMVMPMLALWLILLRWSAQFYRRQSWLTASEE